MVITYQQWMESKGSQRGELNTIKIDYFTKYFLWGFGSLKIKIKAFKIIISHKNQFA